MEAACIELKREVTIEERRMDTTLKLMLRTFAVSASIMKEEQLCYEALRRHRCLNSAGDYRVTYNIL